MMRRTPKIPPQVPTRFEALKLVIEAYGTHEDTASAFGVHQSTVSRWVSSSKQLPGEYVLKAEAETGVSRHYLRPDLYPLDMPPGPRWYGVDLDANRIHFIGMDFSKGAAA